MNRTRFVVEIVKTTNTYLVKIRIGIFYVSSVLVLLFLFSTIYYILITYNTTSKMIKFDFNKLACILSL